MALYIDDPIWAWHGLRWCHLMADSIDELHRFAAGIDIQRISYQGPPRTALPHYDLTGFERRVAIARGAQPCGHQEIVAVIRRVRTTERATANTPQHDTGRDDAQDLGPRHVGQRSESDVGDRRARPAA